MVKAWKPKIGFVFENVAGLEERHPEVLEALRRGFDAAGYYTVKNILNTKDYGVPQDRRRLFIVGFKRDTSLQRLGIFEWPKKRKDRIALKTALYGVPAEIGIESPDGLPQHDTKPKNNYPYYPGLKTKRRDYRQRFNPGAPSPTIVTDHYNNMLHPLVDRHLTVRELAILQGVRNDFIFCGTAPKDNAKMIANGVPPRLAAAVMLAVRRHIKKTNK